MILPVPVTLRSSRKIVAETVHELRKVGAAGVRTSFAKSRRTVLRILDSGHSAFWIWPGETRGGQESASKSFLWIDLAETLCPNCGNQIAVYRRDGDHDRTEIGSAG